MRQRLTATRLLSLLTVVAALAVGGCSDPGNGPDTNAGRNGNLARAAAIEPASLQRSSGQDLPNIVFILVDTLRADRLGSYGHADKLTPQMDQLAAEGVRFSRAISPAPWTLPSIASIMTGYQAMVHKANSFRKIDHMDRGVAATVAMLDDEGFVTLAEHLKQSGYETAGFVANKFIKRKYGMAQGFDHYDTEFTGNTVQGGLLNERALAWLKNRDSDKPFFLYMHYMDVHGPYDSDPKFLDQTIGPIASKNPSELTPLGPQVFGRINPYLKKPPKKSSDPTRWNRLKGFREYWDGRYNAGVAEMDFYLGQLFEGLKAANVWDDAYVVLTSDHGEALGEHGFWDHGYSQFQTDVSVPLIIRWPGTIPAGRVVPETASLLGLTPTILDQLQIPFEQNAQGESLVNHMAASDSINDFAIAEAIKVGPTQLAIIRGNWKLIAMQHPQTGQVNYGMFDLATDPGETINRVTEQQDKFKELSKELARFVQQSNRLKPGVKASTATVNPAELEKLQGLGYTGEDEEEDD